MLNYQRVRRIPTLDPSQMVAVWNSKSSGIYHCVKEMRPKLVEKLCTAHAVLGLKSLESFGASLHLKMLFQTTYPCEKGNCSSPPPKSREIADLRRF